MAVGTIALRYIPEKNWHTGRVFIINYPWSASEPEQKTKGKSVDAGFVNKPIEMRHLELRRGVRFVTPEEWEMVLRFDSARRDIETIINRGALAVYVPDAYGDDWKISAIGATPDFASMEAVSDIIAHCGDAIWLEDSIAHEKRRDVLGMLRKRIQAIKEDGTKNVVDTMQLMG